MMQSPNAMWTRQDGGWRSHPISVLWRVDPNVNYRIMDRALSCRRVPTHILNHAGHFVFAEYPAEVTRLIRGFVTA